MTTKRLHLIVIAGPNGAEKSTIDTSLLKGMLPVTEFVDDKFIECAVALKADAVITGNRKVLALKEYTGIRILTPL